VTIIRPATVEDCDKVGALQVKTWLETYRGLLPDTVLVGLSTVEQAATWRRILSREPPGSMVIAELPSRMLVGFAGGGIRRGKRLDHDSEVYALYVLGAAQRQGIGRRLMAAVGRELRAKGGRSICLWVLRDNVPARQFYEALGGMACGEKIESMGGRKLPEIAYGWDDIDRFISRCDDKAEA
jgi:ribosomal protein S18 acetylase RimI-like enzyme